jgi:hypothetical protein
MRPLERVRDVRLLAVCAGWGVFLLILIALRLSGARFGASNFPWLIKLTWVADAAAVVAIWTGYRKMLRRLETLAGRLPEEMLNRVVNFCTAMVCLAYFLLSQAVG